MKLKIIACAFFSLFPLPSFAYDGPIIDAHSQIDCETTADLVSQKLRESEIRYSLIGARPCAKNLFRGQYNLDKLKNLEPDRVGQLASTKLGNKTFDTMHWQSNSVGVAEIIFQHNALDVRDFKFEGYSRPIKGDKLIKEVKSKGAPVIIHIELKDFPEKREETLKDLSDELSKDPAHPILLIHMGQFDVDLAKDFLNRHKNLYFLMSMTTPVRLIPAAIGRDQGQISQQGWESLFTKNRWREDWRALIQKYPDNFILAFDNVFKRHWESNHIKQAKFWRKALNDLDDKTARKIACENASHLWRLNIECK
jgi:hypothetical protein